MQKKIKKDKKEKETNYNLRKAIPMEYARRETKRGAGHWFQKVELPSKLAPYFANQSAQLLPSLNE
jgi:hypothetical protein